MKIIIIGGVAAGMSAAAKASRLNKDAEIVIYEKTDVVSWGACGLPYYVGDFFQSPNNMIARPVEKFIEAGMNIKIKHEVISINVNKKEITIKNLLTDEIFTDNYDKLMVATGAHAVMPPIKNLNTNGVYTLKEYTDGIVLKEEMLKEENQNIVIVGAGYIGLEVAEAAKHLGKKSVRIIQLGDRVLLESFDKEITDVMEEEIRSHEDVELHLEEIVQEIVEENGKVIAVKTNKGEYLADIVVISTGVRPNTAFLKETGIEMLSNGALVIDNHGKTSIDSIYSAGDCATVPHLVRNENVYIPLATTANKIGRVVGENLAGVETVFQGTLGSAAVKVMNVEAGRTGITEAEAIKMGIEYKTVFIKDKNQTNYYPGREDIFVKLIYDAKTRVLLGGQIAGKKGAVLRVDSLATAIYSKLTVDEIGMMDFCYAPPFARTWDVMNVAGNVAK
ncbi:MULTISPECIES: CoA-disulfide reductase [Cetobacterium]|jgi:NADPH-dependent 2,4-dienoyl-CoA reductase/sulfur reductase-like enzyme|uniref:CoA-disulfide reductase n=1 Tax=Candidatus Cetobacterium colombiensis TaxID=3073100 RepID=A0ABU4WB70_9FUSO|nr:CoA-disulfide reductase [Candidatus Cetobacterium colombiensis]MDX8336766.1 CoA-disulfide reductase [Candidatus Cetobacterium colombiensis]